MPAAVVKSFTMLVVAAALALSALAQDKAAPATQQPRSSVRQTQADLEAAYQAKQWDKAIELSKKLIELDPASPVHPYNLACVSALGGKSAEALKALEQAAEKGFEDVSLISTDRDLDSIRSDPAFAKSLDRIKKNHDKTLDEFKRKADKSEPLIFVPEGLVKDQPAPVIVVLHGFGSTAEDVAGAWKAAADQAGAVLVAPRAVTPAGAGFEWGAVDQAEYLVLRAIDAAAKQHKLDDKRVILSGFSQGGLMAYAIGVRNPAKFAGLIPVAANWQAGYAPAPKSAAGFPRIFAMVGSKDPVLDANRQAAGEFEKAGVKIKLNVYDGVGHAFPSNRDEELRKALDFIFAK